MRIPKLEVRRVHTRRGAHEVAALTVGRSRRRRLRPPVGIRQVPPDLLEFSLQSHNLRGRRAAPRMTCERRARAQEHPPDAAHPRHLQLLIDGLHRKFPALTGIEIDYSWWGWVDVSHDMMPRIFRPDPARSLFYALGYGGNGVSYSAQAGRRMAEMIGGRAFKGRDLPIFTSPLPTHPFTPFRRIGQRILYRWYHTRDEAI